MTERDPIDLSLRAGRAARDAGHEVGHEVGHEAAERIALERSLADAVSAVRRARTARRQRRALVATACLVAATAAASWPWAERPPRETAPPVVHAIEAPAPISKGMPRIVRLDDEALLAELAAARIDATLRCIPRAAGRCELTLLAGNR
ncbi:MAG: hypothetical protein GC172_02720 [Phycisphaera sp.]|nr:hypothetical protein [Phycisphaera sp.]